MRLPLCSVTVAAAAWGAIAFAQEPKKDAPKAEVVKATYLVKGLH
jgi:hypothetical protein